MTVEQKLKTLFQLQTMLSKIDEIKTLRGELPLEVQDLEDEIAGLSTRIDKIKAEVDELKSAIAGKRVEIETAKASVEKYKSQQDNVRNNREYDFLTKEIEFEPGNRTLRKRIKEFSADREEKEAEVVKNEQILSERQKDLEQKKGELDEIISETKQEEEKLRDKAKDPKLRLNRVCCSHSNVSVRTPAMDWALYMYNVTRAVVALTRFRLRDSWTSVPVRK